MTLIQQLRDVRKNGPVTEYKSLSILCKEAADHIEKLEAAIKPFADEGSKITTGPQDVTIHARQFSRDELIAALCVAKDC